MIAESLDVLLLQLFDVAASSQWDHWLDAARGLFGAAAASLIPLGAGWMGAAWAGVTPERQSAYSQHFHNVDLWSQRMRAAPSGTPHSMQMVVPDKELLKSEFYNDFMRPAGRRYGLGVAVDAGTNRFMLAFGRSKADRDFDADDFKALQRVSGFLKRALDTQRLIHVSDAESKASHEVLNQSARGILLLDANYRIVFANKVASSLLASDDIIGIRGNQLVALSRTDERKLRDALDAAISRPGQQSLLTLSGTRSEDQVTAAIAGLAPARQPLLDFGVARPSIVVNLTARSQRTEVAPEFLETIFGFTAKEARVASLLVSGLDLGDVATSLSIGRETARHHLKSLFWKTSTHSQRELVHLITTALPTSALRSSSLSTAQRAE